MINMVDILNGKSFPPEFPVGYNKNRCRHQHVCSPSGRISRQYLATKNWQTLTLKLLLLVKFHRKISKPIVEKQIPTTNSHQPKNRLSFLTL